MKLSDTELDRDECGMAERVLQSGEAVCWAGKPVMEAFPDSSWQSVVKGSLVILCLLFACYRMQWDMAVIIICCPFLLLGLAGLAAPWFVRRRWRKSLYVLTDRRALVWRPNVFGLMQRLEWPLETGCVKAVQYFEDGKGGNVIFGFIRRSIFSEFRWQEEGFLQIADVRNVVSLMGSHVVGETDLNRGLRALVRRDLKCRQGLK